MGTGLPSGTVASKQRLLAWRGLDPDRIDAARVMLRDDGMIAHGTSCASDHTLTYRLDASAEWITRALDVHCRSDHADVRLQVARDQAGVWTARRWISGRPDDCTLPDLAGALDVDLALCPLTNTMPVRRARLLHRPEAHERFVMAWISVPDLRIHRSCQQYGPVQAMEPAGTAVQFASDGFAATIFFDPDGLVLAYPGIGNRLPD